jgi:DNA-binding IclR family transcriptional regulator
VDLSQAKKSANGATIQSVQRAAAILHSFTKLDSELSVTHLSEQLGLHKSTISRLLSTLQHEDLVEQNPETGRYRLGLGLVTLAGIVLDRIDIREIAYPYVRSLAELSQETVNVVVLSSGECMNIGGADSPKSIQYVGRIGRRTPLHCTSAGQVLLAYMPAADQATLLAAELLRFTQKTIVDRQRLAETIAQVRGQGYAITHEEHQEALSAIAAPIRNHTTAVVAALTISGPTFRMGPAKIEAFIDPIIETARLISGQLGFVPDGAG